MKDKFKIFVCKDLKSKLAKHDKDRDALVKEAALFCGVPNWEFESGNGNILRTSKGKPYFDKLNMHFSVSHSDDLWTCLMGPSCCGLDVQYIKPCNFQKIAGRFFSQNEQVYVDEYGLEGFFEIWAMREAYGKYTGDGFWGKMPDFVHCGKPIISVNISLQDDDRAPKSAAKKLKFVHLDVEPGTKCVACIEATIDNIEIEWL